MSTTFDSLRRGDGSSSAVSSMAIAVCVGISTESGSPSGTATECRVGRENTSVHNVDIRSTAGFGVVRVREGQVAVGLVCQLC